MTKPAAPAGVAELVGLEPVDYGGSQTGPLYRRAQVYALVCTTALRTADQTLALAAESVQIALPERVSREAVLALLADLRGQYIHTLVADLNLAAALEPTPQPHLSTPEPNPGRQSGASTPQ